MAVARCGRGHSPIVLLLSLLSLLLLLLITSYITFFAATAAGSSSTAQLLFIRIITISIVLISMITIISIIVIITMIVHSPIVCNTCRLRSRTTCTEHTLVLRACVQVVLVCHTCTAIHVYIDAFRCRYAHLPFCTQYNTTRRARCASLASQVSLITLISLDGDNKNGKYTYVMRILYRRLKIGGSPALYYVRNCVVTLWQESAAKTSVEPCRVSSRLVVPCRAVPCRAVPCRAVPCRAVPCRAEPCRAVP